MTNVQEYIEAAVRTLERDGSVSPYLHDDYDNYEDAALDVVQASIGAPNAAQKSSMRKWLREDWDNYVSESEE